MLAVIRWINIDTGYTEGISTGESLKLTTEISPYLLGQKLRNNVISGITRYGINENECELILMSKEWIKLEGFKGNLSEISKIINEELSKGLEQKNRMNDIIQRRLNINILNNYNHLLMDKYGEEIIENNTIIGYKINKNEGVSVKRFINKLGQECNEVTIKELIDGKFKKSNINELIKWCDIKIDEGFIREIDELKFYFNKKGDSIKMEGSYKYPMFPVNDIEYTYNDKIGSFDLETYGDEGIGNQEVYAGGWATKNHRKYFYIDEGENVTIQNRSEDVVNSRPNSSQTGVIHWGLRKT